MAQGIKRSGPSEPQSASKKSRPSRNKSKDRRSSPQKEQPSEDDLDEDDTLGDGTPDMDVVQAHLAAVRQRFATRDDWPKQFTKKLDDDQASAKKILDEMKNKLNDDKKSLETSLVPLFEAALGPIDDADRIQVDNDHLLHVPFPSTANQVFAQNIDALFKDCAALTKIYRTLASVDLPRSSVPKLEAELKADKAAVTHGVAVGRKLVQRDIDCMLADRYDEVRERSDLTADDEQRGRVLLMQVEREGGGREGVGLGEMTYNLAKVAKKMDRVGRRGKRER